MEEVMSGGSAPPEGTAEEEKLLVRRAARGDEEAFRGLVLAHQQRIFALLVRMTGDRDVARELTQDCFVRAFRGLRAFREEAAFATWLTRIALNVANSYFSSRSYRERRRTGPLEPYHERLVPPATEDSFDTTALARLQEAIGCLPDRSREVIALCALELKSYEEAAQILKIPVGTVRSRLHNARRMLRKLYFGE